MLPMDERELLALLRSGDVHQLLVRVGEMWLAKYSPDSRYAQLLADAGPGVPMQRVVISGRRTSSRLSPGLTAAALLADA